MKLEKILETLNSFEKNSFLKIIDSILSDKPKNFKEIDKILSETSKDLKSIDNLNISKVFMLLEEEYKDFIRKEFLNTTSQLDILIDIISRDGNCIMKQDWFARLYEKEIAELNKKTKTFKQELESEKSEFTELRKRDYLIYKNCLKVAYYNDELNNQDKKVTNDEQSILIALANELELSQEEVKLINYLIIPINKLEIDNVINDLKSLGIIFYSKKTNTIYVAEEVVNILRKVRGKEVSDKYFRRVLKFFKDGQINQICRKHGVDWKLPIDQKIKNIINGGISFTGILKDDIHKDGTNLTDKKKFLNDFFDNGLKISPTIKGTLIEEKISNLIKYFEEIERDEKVGISLDGYSKLLSDLGGAIPKFNDYLKLEFEFQEENVLKSEFLLDFNIKPRDILELLSKENIELFCNAQQIKLRGDVINNILENYKDADNLYLENYENIGYRDLAALKNNGLAIKEADLGIKFEDLTKTIFSLLGFNVDEELRKNINTNKDKADIIVNIGNNEIIIVECKTSKESGYNKFSTVSRQLKSYENCVQKVGFKVVKSLLIAPEFSDDFVKECGLDYELNLSLITASSLYKILNGFKASKLKVFPYNLLMRDVLIQEERILKAIGR
jgi:hypothetical protein